jgi:hypothetical protein
MGVVSVSYPIEKLVIKIIETKAGLQNYKNRSINSLYRPFERIYFTTCFCSFSV